MVQEIGVKGKTGIGERGKSLGQMLAESERLWRETGCYYGMEELSYMKEDPLKMELFHSRLISALIAARETTRMIAANPFVREVAELCTAFYTPEGDCVGQSTGIIIHIPLMGQVIKWMIQHDYEEEVAINDGDIFCSNDNQIAGMHPLDVYDIMPVFWEGELVSWVATCIMTMEIGAITPGIQPVLSIESFTDGFRISAEKIGMNDKIRKDWELGCYHKLRLPEMFILDRKGALAANLKAREEIRKTIAEFGLDYFRRAVKELIESERRAHLERIKTRTMPGRFRTYHLQEQPLSKLPLPPIHRKDHYTLVPIDFHIKPDGKIFLDFDGAGPWGWHASNCSPSALSGAASLTVTMSTAYTGKANMGTMLTVDYNIPYDTILWPSQSKVGTMGFFDIALNLGGHWLNMISRSFFARGFREEILLGQGAVTGWIMGGKDQYGREPYGFIAADMGGTTGSGACGIRDGLDNSFAMWHPEPDAGNIEVWELVMPVIWLGRKLEPTSAGYGKYRSGYSMCSTFLVHKTPTFFLNGIVIDCREKFLPDSGIFGGHTGPGMCVQSVKDANTGQLISQNQPLVHEIGDPREPDMIQKLQGQYHVYPSGIFLGEDVLSDGDVIQVLNFGHAGGYGDPIDRDPVLVQKDLDNGLCSLEACRKIYCVQADYENKTKEYNIDEQKTKELRELKRKERLRRGIPGKEWWEKRRETVLNKELPPLLKEMYNGSLAKGERWPKEFRAFWDLPDDFIF
jgi:acetone carboxylase alpha subunit